MRVDGKRVADWRPVPAKDDRGGLVDQTSNFATEKRRTAAPG